jgi:hypothetical protein
MDDQAFITMMGVDVATFQHILTSGFGNAWNTTPISCKDTFLRDSLN